MFLMNKKFKRLIFSVLTVLLLFLSLYIFVLPKIVSNLQFVYVLEKFINKNFNAELIINHPVLKTSIKPEISFGVENLSLKKDGETLLALQNFDAKINFYKIFVRKITLEKLGADNIYIDINKLQKLSFKDKKKEKKKGKSFFKLECFNTLFYVKKCAILYESSKGVLAKLLAKDLEISDSREPKMLHFGVYLDLYHNNQHLKLFFKERNNVYFKNRKLHADDFKFKVNNSEVTVNLLLDEKGKYDLSFASDKFEIDNVNQFLNTDLIIPDGHEFVSCFKDFTGDFNFKLNLKNDKINGFFKINKIGAKLIPLANIPVTLTQGLITINSNDIEFMDFKGFYGLNNRNSLEMKGAVKDYLKTAQTEIFVNGKVYDEFAKYLSKLAGIKINVKNSAKTDFKISFANGEKMDILGSIFVPKGSDVLFEDASISPVKYDREISINMDLLKENLSINNIDYRILGNDNSIAKPLVTVNGKVNIASGFLNELGFNIPEPLPTEFFNVLLGRRIFRRGTFSGNMKFVNSKIPYLDGNVALKDTFIVGQGLIIKNMDLKSKNESVKVNSEGIFRRARYKFDADMQNKMLFPLIINDINLTFDEIDVEKIIQTFAPRPQQPVNRPIQNRPKIELAKSNISSEYFDIEDKKQETSISANDEAPIVFQPNLVEIKKCMLNVGKGVYKKINFGNLHADLTLSRGGILQIHSNKFDFAEGNSALKVYCDLAREKYSIRLGAKDVDTDAISTSILNLSKEITGKAKALIELNTDSTFKLNGKMQFEINDGSIAKLGLIQYVLNMASVFRNPLAMVSPVSVFDMVNIPEGSFKKINGTLIIADNSIKALMIKSSSPQLSAFIVGRINLENMDASLRIYTKFNDKNDGVFGFLRGFSLNALARKARTYTKGENISYYAAELEMLPKLETGDETAQVFITKFDGDIQSANFISSLKKIK